jgi:signal transduction histidine kinase
MTSAASPQVGRLSTRVALGGTALIAVLYMVIGFAIVVWVSVSLTAQVDARLERSLTIAAAGARDGTRTTKGAVAPDGGIAPLDASPFGRGRVTWRVAADSTVTSTRTDLALPAEHIAVIGPTTVEIDGNAVRISGMTIEDGHIIVGESMDPVTDARTTVMVGLFAIAPFLLAGVFVGSLTVGRRVAMPIERARQRQLAFTADASHELRTPLAVIEANASLSLAEERDAAWYQHSFEQVLDETRRMRRLIEDLLWLARFDAHGKPAQHEPVDLGVLVEGAADRFAAIAERNQLALEVRIEARDSALVAPPEWIDGLVGVLLDNACKYSPSGGRVEAIVSRTDGRVALSIEDSGPGIPPEQRDFVFDRFRRASEEHGGSGLGLAIADAVVSATSGRWDIGTSPLGGARMSTSWVAPRPDQER